MITFGQPHRHVARCDSTNDLARDWARDPDDPAPSGALVSADFQARGRGQRGRAWEAGAGESALLSFVYRLPPGAEVWPLGLVTALAVADALESVAALEAQIKWPNDVLIGGRKVAGVLIEVAGGVAILGTGINVNQTAFRGVDGFVTPPTSLRLASGRELGVEDVRTAVGASLSAWEARGRAGGPASIVGACRARLAVGAAVRRGLETGTAETGALAGLEDDGAARVRLPGGTFARWDTVN